jgi:hypothetical protein
MFNDGGNSIATSLESFEEDRLIQNQATLSMFQAEESEGESDHSSTPWSPPAWRKGTSGWQQRHNLPPHSDSLSNSRSASPRYESADEGEDTLLATRIPLPASPEKDSPRNSLQPTPQIARMIRSTKSPSALAKYSTERATSPPNETPENCMFTLQLFCYLTNLCSFSPSLKSRDPTSHRTNRGCNYLDPFQGRQCNQITMVNIINNICRSFRINYCKVCSLATSRSSSSSRYLEGNTSCAKV